jgi:hypothetical protein
MKVSVLDSCTHLPGIYCQMDPEPGPGRWEGKSHNSGGVTNFNVKHEKN